MPALGQMELPLQSGRKEPCLLQLWAGPVAMPTSRSGYCKDQGPIPLWLVRALEINPEAGHAPAEWILFTARPVNPLWRRQKAWAAMRGAGSLSASTTCSGQGLLAERLQADDFKRLAPALTLLPVAALRVLSLTLAGQARPSDKPDGLLEDEQHKVLEKWARKLIISVGQCIQPLSRLGGYMGKKPPGTIPIWHGLMVL